MAAKAAAEKIEFSYEGTTSGTPACIMVAIWRAKMAMSAGSGFLAPPNRAWGFFLTLIGLMPCLRSSLLARVSLSA